MTKATPSALKTHMAAETTSIATCWKVTRTDSVTFGFTDHDVDIVYDGVTYKAATGISESAAQYKDDMSVGNMDVLGAVGLDSDDIKESALIAGLFDYAELWIFRLNWANTSQGIDKVFYGRLGEVSVDRSRFTAQVVDNTSLLHQSIGQLTSAKCRHTLGDAGCGVELQPAAWQATTAYASAANDYDPGDMVSPTGAQVNVDAWFECTVAGTSGGTQPTWNPTLGLVTIDNTILWTARKRWTKSRTVNAPPANRYQFESDVGLEDDDWYNGGKVTFTSGANNGLSMEVKDWVKSTRIVTLVLPMPYDIAAGDTYAISAGCNHLRDLTDHGDALGDCVAKFGNAHNYGGEPDIPGLDRLVEK